MGMQWAAQRRSLLDLVMQGKATRRQATSLALVHVFRARCPPRSAHHTFAQLDEQEFAMQVSQDLHNGGYWFVQCGDENARQPGWSFAAGRERQAGCEYVRCLYVKFQETELTNKQTNKQSHNTFQKLKYYQATCWKMCFCGVCWLFDKLLYASKAT